MSKKDIKKAEAQFHAFIKSQQKPDIETEIVFMDGEEERRIPIKIKQRISTEQKLTFINRVVDCCKDEFGYELMPSNFDTAFNLAVVEFFTDIKERVKDEDLLDFIDCFDVVEFISKNCPEEIYMNICNLHRPCYNELDWEKEKYLNSRGVNEVFIKLNDLLERVDFAMDSMGDYINKEKIEELLNAVNTVAEAPEQVAEKVLEIERAHIEEERGEE